MGDESTDINERPGNVSAYQKTPHGHGPDINNSGARRISAVISQQVEQDVRGETSVPVTGPDNLVSHGHQGPDQSPVCAPLE